MTRSPSAVTVPYVIAACAISLDGYLDDASDRRLILSHDDDFDRVDEARAGCDAILVGARTIRRDDPRLVVRSAARIARRVSDGRAAQPMKVTLTRSGRLDPGRAFFTAGPAERLVYASGETAVVATALGARATVVRMPRDASPRWLLHDLAARGVGRLLVEGGSEMLTWFLAEDAVDELHVSIAPFFLGEPEAVRVVGPARFPFGPDRRMPLRRVDQVGDMVVAVYQLRPSS